MMRNIRTLGMFLDFSRKSGLLLIGFAQVVFYLVIMLWFWDLQATCPSRSDAVIIRMRPESLAQALQQHTPRAWQAIHIEELCTVLEHHGWHLEACPLQEGGMFRFEFARLGPNDPVWDQQVRALKADPHIQEVWSMPWRQVPGFRVWEQAVGAWMLVHALGVWRGQAIFWRQMPLQARAFFFGYFPNLVSHRLYFWYRMFWLVLQGSLGMASLFMVLMLLWTHLHA